MHWTRIILLFVLVVFVFDTNAQNKTNQPSIVIFMADDLGWADLSSYGSTFYETPNLDELAKKGIRFTQGYATCPVCSPSRASMMTGKYPIKTGVTDWIRGRQSNDVIQPYEKLITKRTAYQLALEENTIAEVAVSQGYKTFLAGKWHLGEDEKFWPESQGFQINKGGWSKGAPTVNKNDTSGGYFSPYNNPRLKDGPPGEYLTDRLADECLDFLSNNSQSPFLLIYSLYAVHTPMQAPSALIEKYEKKKKQLNITDRNRFVKDEPWMQYETGWKRRTVQDNPVYAAMMENMDTNVGRIVEKLKQLGIEENTLVIFTSDNGGLSTAEGSPTANNPLRAGKGWLYEGGIRVPLILYWKGKTVSGTISPIPVTTADFFPTIAKAINSNYAKGNEIDGNDIFQLLSDSVHSTDRELFWHYPHYSNQGGKPGSAVRQGIFKLIYNYEDESTELYDLENDIAEENNISGTNKKIARKLKKKLFAWLTVNHALFPDKNPDYQSKR